MSTALMNRAPKLLWCASVRRRGIGAARNDARRRRQRQQPSCCCCAVVVCDIIVHVCLCVAESPRAVHIRVEHTVEHTILAVAPHSLRWRSLLVVCALECGVCMGVWLCALAFRVVAFRLACSPEHYVMARPGQPFTTHTTTRARSTRCSARNIARVLCITVCNMAVVGSSSSDGSNMIGPASQRQALEPTPWAK